MVIKILVITIVVASIICIIYALQDKTTMSEQGKPKDDKTPLEQLNSSIILLEVVRQAKMVGDEATVQAVMNNTYQGPIPVEIGGHFTSIYPDNLLILSIAGINYAGNLENYVGNFDGVLIPEPKNEFDPNAIKVLWADRKALGYIPKDRTQQVRELIGCKGNEWKHPITGTIDKCQDEEEYNREFYSGIIYIAK